MSTSHELASSKRRPKFPHGLGAVALQPFVERGLILMAKVQPLHAKGGQSLARPPPLDHAKEIFDGVFDTVRISPVRLVHRHTRLGENTTHVGHRAVSAVAR